MSDRAALLAAIVAHPDDDTPRLVYADWLDEHGDAKRAAHIRAQVARCRADEADTATNTACEFIERNAYRELDRLDWPAVDADVGAELAARKARGRWSFNMKQKAEGLPRVRGVLFDPDERGFYGHALVEDTASFLKHADAIFRAAPITSIELEELTAEQATAFVSSGHLARVRAIELVEYVEPEAIRVLGSAGAAAGVRKLEFHLGDDAADLVEALAAGRHWTGLRHLEAFDTEDDGGGMPLHDVLARPQFRGLRRLNMWGAGLDDQAARVVAKKLPELRYLDLSVNPISGNGVDALTASKSLRHLRYLDLGTCELEDGGTAAAKLINTKNLPNLCVLNLSSNGFTGPDPKPLAKPGRGPTLRALDLDSTYLTPEGTEALARCPALQGVRHLRLGNTRIGDEHFERFLAHAAFERLACLDLHSNNVGASGAKALAAWPGAANLQWLDLGSNPIGETGAKALAASPHLKGLKYLHFKGRGAATLKNRFKKAFG